MKKNKMPHPILIGTVVFWTAFILLIYLLTR